MASNPIINNLWAACNKMRQDPGTTGALQYIQQFSWLLFLKVFEETEKKRQTECELEGNKFQPNISPDYTWSKWAYNKDLTGANLIKFVNDDLFPYLRALNKNKTQQTIANIFINSVNLMQDGYLLKEAIEKIRDTNFFSDDESFAISEIYEGLFSKMKASDLKPLAEFYTPRPIGKFMTEMVNPEIGETVYDPANGPSGFLVEAFYLLKKKATSSRNIQKLHEETLYGKEIKPLPFVLGMMNLILNGVEAPNITKTNTLAINLFQLTERDRYNIVLTNPPFSGQLKGVSSNFPYPSSATEILFLQHAMRSLKHKGRCAIIFPEGVLFTTNEQAYVNTKKELIENFNLHTIVKLPSGSFAPYTPIATNILFFDKLSKTKSIWYYEVQVPNSKKNFTKTNPIRYENFSECIALWEERPETENSWIIPLGKIIEENYNLNFKNPNKEETAHLSPKQIFISIENSEQKISKYTKDIKSSFWLSLRDEFKNIEWKEDKLNNIFFPPQYGYTASASNIVSTYKLLRITDIQNNNVIWETVPYCSIKDEEAKKYLISNNDFLFARTGGTTGKSYLVKNPEPSVFASYLIRLKPKFNGKMIDYMQLFFNSPYYWNQIIEHSSGTAQPNLNGKKLSNISVLYPANEKYQDKLIDFFKELNIKVNEFQNEVKKLNTSLKSLVPSILNKAFKGE